MLLILLSWIYIFFTTINLGVATAKILPTKNNNTAITSLIGLFTITLLACFWAIFDRINIEFQIFLLVVNGVTFIKYKSDIINLYNNFIHSFYSLRKGLQVYLIIILLLIIAQCASIPYIIDNETYYIQTIKWLNEYGFVKGLANLHIFLGQTSCWHITQSVFNFQFLYGNFNDLSGFCLFLGNLFAIEKLNSYYISNKKNYLLIGLLPLANPLFFQFISAPSPDLPIYILALLIFFYFIENYKTISIELFNTITLLSLFSVFIKSTSFLLFLIPISLSIIHFNTLRKNLFPSFTVGFIVLGLFITKNSIISGYPFFPLTSFSLYDYDYKVPKELIEFYFSEKRLYRFFLANEMVDSLNFFEKVLKWLSMEKISGLFNWLSVILLIVSPYLIKKYFAQKSYWFLYGIMFIQLILLIKTSPQFRFMIHFILFFSFLIVSLVLYKKLWIHLSFFISFIFLVILLFFPVKYNLLTQNKLIINNSRFNKKNIVFPHQNSKLKTEFQKEKNGNLLFNSPDAATFFWANGNGELPCVNLAQINYFGSRFHYVPQLRTTNLKDGFYSKKWLP